MSMGVGPSGGQSVCSNLVLGRGVNRETWLGACERWAPRPDPSGGTPALNDRAGRPGDDRRTPRMSALLQPIKSPKGTLRVGIAPSMGGAGRRLYFS